MSSLDLRKQVAEKRQLKPARTPASRPAYAQPVCVVTGTGSRFVPIPELFDSVATVARQDASPLDAYAQVDALEQRLVAVPADIFLLSLGPTATVLAARLSRRGRRAIDIGHITSSDRTVFLGADRPEHQPMTPTPRRANGWGASRTGHGLGVDPVTAPGPRVTDWDRGPARRPPRRQPYPRRFDRVPRRGWRRRRPAGD